jgi:hypothetical protein
MANIDLKAATPAASISDTGFLFGAESQGDAAPKVYQVAAIKELIRDTIGAALVAGTNITVTVDDAGDTIAIAGLSDAAIDERARDALGTALVAGTGISITVDDAGDKITIGATGGGGGSSLSFHVTGKYYLGSASRVPSGGAQAASANVLWASPVEIREAITIDALGGRSGSTTPAGNIRFGIYSQGSTTKRPDTLLAETGSIAVAATTVADIAGALGSPLSVSPGIYWFAMVADAALMMIPLQNTAPENNILVGGTLTDAVSPASWAANHFRRTSSHTFGTMPSSFGTGADNSGSTMPCIAYRVG